MDETYPLLAKAAAEASGNAYAPVTGYKVGAAVYAIDEAKQARVMVTGANVEFTSIVAIHAEVVALCNTMLKKLKPIAIAIATKEGIYPACGACRQLIIMANPDMVVIACDLEGTIKVVSTIKELYPYAFIAAPAELKTND
jgi:cytidine deaminase